MSIINVFITSYIALCNIYIYIYIYIYTYIHIYSHAFQITLVSCVISQDKKKNSFRYDITTSVTWSYNLVFHKDLPLSFIALDYKRSLLEITKTLRALLICTFWSKWHWLVQILNSKFSWEMKVSKRLRFIV